MSNGGGTSQPLRFRPNPNPDGAFELPQGAPIPVLPPDWDRALDLLRKINALRNLSGDRVSSLLGEEGFEPWWYSQDRLLRFYLVPLTQLLPLLDILPGTEKYNLENVPPDLERVLRAIGGKMGFPPVESAGARALSAHTPGQWAMWALSVASLAAFRTARRDTVFYIIDHVNPGLREDFRFSPLYREMENRKIRYAEFAHTLSPYQAIKNFFRRRRPVFFLESADFWAQLAGERITPPSVEFPADGSRTAEERALRALVPIVLTSSAQSIARQRILKRVLRFLHIRRALIFDDNRHNYELIAACRSLQIPILGFQHGVFNQFHAGSMAFGFSGSCAHTFDRYGVWSDLFRDRLLRQSALYRPEQVFVAGPIRPPDGSTDSPNRTKKEFHSSDKIRVLAVSEPLARKSEVASFFQTLLQDPRIELSLKIRPGESGKSLEEYTLPVERVRVLQSGTVYEAFAQADVVIGTYSTVLYEAALMGIPIVWMKTTRAYGRELAEEHLAEAAETPQELSAAILRALALPESELRERRDRIWGKEIRNGAVSVLNALEQLGGQ